MTKTEQQKTLESMRQQLEWRQQDVVTISAMADLSEDLGKSQDEVDTLRSAAIVAGEVEKLEQRIHKLKKETEAQVKLLNSKICEARRKCPHPVTKYYPDPSGNNDSTTTCLCCGADL